MQNVFAADKALPLWDAFDCGRCRGGKNAKTYRETPTTTIGIVFFSFCCCCFTLYTHRIYICIYFINTSFHSTGNCAAAVRKARGCCCCCCCRCLFCLFALVSFVSRLRCVFISSFLRIFCFRFVSFGTAAAVQQHPLAVRERKKGRERETKRTRATPKQQ